MQLANSEKIRLEEKQRALRAFRAKRGIEHKPIYFDKATDYEAHNKDDVRYNFNFKYFEDREKQDWSASPDIFSE